MKILIIGVSRSGTNSLQSGIESQNYFSIKEPFNTGLLNGRTHRYPIKEFDLHKNVVVKTLSHHIPTNINLDLISFYKIFLKDFNSIILLDRKDIISHRESFLHLNWRIDNKEPVMQRWQIEDIPEYYKVEFGYGPNNRYSELHNQKKYIKLLSNEFNIPISYYEDLYGTDRQLSFDIIKSWNLNLNDELLNEYLSPKNKLRQFKKKI